MNGADATPVGHGARDFSMCDARAPDLRTRDSRPRRAGASRGLAAGALVALLLSWLTLATAAAADLVIGVAGPMTGPLADAGRQFVDAASLAAEDINRRGGLNGARVKLVTADDEATAAGGKKAAAKLVGAGARIVIGHYTSTATMAGAPIYSQNGVLVLAPVAIIARLTENGEPTLFRLAARHDAQAGAAARHLAQQFPNEPVAVLDDGTTFSRALAAAAVRALADEGVKPALIGDVGAGAQVTAPAADRLARRIAGMNIAAIFWTGAAGDAVRILSALRARKSRVTLIGTEALATPDFLAVAEGVSVEGVRMTLAADFAAQPQAAALLERLRAQGKGRTNAAEPGEAAVGAFAAMELIAQAASRSASNDPLRLAEALRSADPFDTVAGPMSFDANGDRREPLYRIHVWTRTEDGGFIFTPL